MVASNAARGRRCDPDENDEAVLKMSRQLLGSILIRQVYLVHVLYKTYIWNTAADVKLGQRLLLTEQSGLGR